MAAYYLIINDKRISGNIHKNKSSALDEATIILTTDSEVFKIEVVQLKTTLTKWTQIKTTEHQ